MRQIKFRAWDYVKNLMIYTFDSSLTWEDCTEDSRFELMQFTGLKDKNGKEIYESDVFQLDPDYPPVSVVWDNAYSGWAFSNGDGFDCYHLHLMEVMGDIHSNPELLEQES